MSDSPDNTTPLPNTDAGATSTATVERTGPYLKVFGPDTGVFDYFLPEGKTITIGRSEVADIRLPHHTVSRVHAMIANQKGDYVLEDANSNYGITVNGNRIDNHSLRHGDSVQISLYVLQFRTHAAIPGAADAAARAKFLLRMEFCLLPSTMRLRFRTLDVGPREIFRTGDTLKVGYGGLLIPADPDAVPENAGALELQLVWPNQKSRRYLGEILGVVDLEGSHWLCVKLHSVPKDIYQVIVAAATQGEWHDVVQT